MKSQEKNYVMENYTRLEEEYKKLKARYELDIRVSHVIVIVGSIQSLIKVLNGKLIQNTKTKMINRKEIRDKIFSYYIKCMENNILSLGKFIELRKLLHMSST